MAGNQGKGIGLMISLSVAIDPNKGIGYKGALPWHLKDELQIFKRNTMHKHIVMGQTTYNGLPGRLKDRYITVISIDHDYKPDDVEVEYDLIEFLKKHEDDETEYIICGGASIYRQSYPYCRKAYVSFVKKEYEVDTHFDAFDLNDWEITLEEDHPDFIYRELERKS